MEEGLVLEQCNFGIFLKEECHKTHFTSKVGLKGLNEVDEELRQVLYWRSGMGVSLVGEIQLNICLHHELKLGGPAFEKVFTKCCDLFRRHKKSVKGGHKISSILAQKLHQLELICVPGWQLCRNCYRKALSEETPNEESAENYDINVDILLDKDEARAILDEILEKLGQSPVKFHGLKVFKGSLYLCKITRHC